MPPSRAEMSASIEVFISALLGGTHPGIPGPRGDLESLGEQLEVVDERLHRGLHLSSARGHTLGVICPHVTGWHLVEALLNDPETLPHLRHPHEVAVITVTIAAHGHVKVDQVIGVIRGGLPDVILDTCAPEHHTAAAPVDGVLGGDDPDVDGSLLPQPVVGHHVLHLVQPLAELGDEFVDVIQEADRDILMYTSWSHVGCVHSGSAGSLVELHHLLPLLEQPEEGGDAAHVEDVGADAHDVVQDPGHLPKQDADVLCPQRNINIQKLLHCQAVALLIAHHAHIVQTVKVRQSLHVGLVFNQLLCASVQQPDVRVSLGHRLSVKLEHEPQYTMSSGVLGTKVKLHVPDKLLRLG